MGLIKRWILKQALKQKTTKSDLESVADEMLKDALKEMQKTRSTANTILRAKIIRQENRKTLEDVNAMDDDYEEDYEDDAPTFEQQMQQTILGKFLGGQNPAPANLNPQQAAETSNLQETINNLTPDQINALKAKFLG